MSKLDLFLVLIPFGCLNNILIAETNKVLLYPVELSLFMRWVGCWLYMFCWVGKTEWDDWWLVTSPVIWALPKWRKYYA